MIEDYAKAYKKGRKAYQKAVLEGRYPFLPALDDILKDHGHLAEAPLGLMEIPLSMVTGTKTRGRQESFSNNYMPILGEKSEFAYKWGKLYDIQVDEGIRDPVKVYEYMWNFYAEEGNKRVSVLKYFNVPDILADVTRLLPDNMEDPAVQIYYEFVEFFKAAPIYELRFSEKGSYQKLADLLKQDLKTPWPEDLIKDLRLLLDKFYEIFRSRGGERLQLTPADAFLIYLSIYPDAVEDPVSAKELEQNISRIWEEFLVEANDDNIDFQEQPKLARKETLLSPILKKGPSYSPENPLRIAFIYDRTPEDSRWIYGHELGRNQLTDKYEGMVQTIAFPACDTEEKFIQAVEDADAGKCEMIFTTSPAQMEYTLRAAIRYPKIKFLNCSINLSHSAVRTYYGRMYEAKFLMGALAASVAEDHRLGYVADYPIFGSLANINAFAQGAALVNPDVRVHLIWSSLKDVNWHTAIREAGIHVLSGPDFIRPVKASREYGIYMLQPDDTIINLATPVWDWGKYYELIVQTILKDTWPETETFKKDQALNYWWGMSAGVIDVILSSHLSYYSCKMVNGIKESLLTGAIHPFAGELHSQTGLIQDAEAGRLSNEQIVSMDWLNDNIIGSLPAPEELSDAGIKAFLASGVNKS